MQIKVNELTLEQKSELQKILDLDFGENLDRRLHESVTCCPHCKHTEIRSAGKARGVQRYKCKSCKKTFNAKTKTAFHCTKKSLDVWNDFLDLMFNYDPMGVRKMGEHLGIHYRTAFHWRHKVMNALAAIEPLTMRGVVEADETYFPLSFKGQKKNFPGNRNPRKRGGEVHIRGISKEKVCVLTAVDRSKNMLLQSTCLARPTGKQVTGVLGAYIATDAVLVTDRHNAYLDLAKHLGLTHRRVESATERRGAYHVQNVNSLHSNLKRFMRPFNGVATKYLDHYLAYYKWKKLDALSAVAVPTASVTRDELTARRMTLK